MKNNYIYLYNNTFINLLNLIKTLIKNKIIPTNIKSFDYIPNLFEETILLDILEDENIIKEYLDYFGKEIFNTIFSLYLSTDENKEIIIFHFLVHSIKLKNKVYYMRNLKSVDLALKISKYVNHENHKYKGFLRFKELENNILYAEIAPTNNIIFLLSNHFKKRLKNEYWIIKDVKRGIISLYDKKNFYFVIESEFSLLTLNFSKNEQFIEDLWKKFYQTIGIAERKNERCRMNFMPKKYWKYIIEMSEEYEKSNK